MLAFWLFQTERVMNNLKYWLKSDVIAGSENRAMPVETGQIHVNS
jgi:hypothetical protein